MLEQLFGSSQILLYFISILYILLNKEFSRVQKIIVVYIMTFCLRLMESISLRYMTIILLLITYIYIGFLSQDEIKNRILTNPLEKLLDLLYKIVFEYSGIYFFISILLISDVWNLKISVWILNNIIPNGIRLALNSFVSENVWIWIYRIISVCILSKAFVNISKREYETESFDTILKKIDNEAKWNTTFRKDIEYEKLMLLSDIEDKSFFYRETTYNFISLEFVQYRIREKKYIWGDYSFLRGKNPFKYIRKLVRGYSTIEMQLIRTLGVRYGYPHFICRKIYELIYSNLFFKNLRKYYNDIYLNTKECVSYKEFLMYVYILVAGVQINGKDYKNTLAVWGKNSLKEVSKEELFISAVGLSHRKINYEIITNYSGIIRRYNLDIMELIQLITKVLRQI